MYKGATGWHRNYATFYIGKFNTGAGQGTGFWVADDGTKDKMNGNSNTDARDQSKIFVIKYDGSGPNATFYINGDQERFYNMNSDWDTLPQLHQTQSMSAEIIKSQNYYFLKKLLVMMIVKK